MNRAQVRNRNRQKQINILHTTTRKRHSQKQLTQAVVWTSLVLAMITAVGLALHFAVSLVLDKALYTNPRYVLNKIEIQPEGHFTPRAIRQAAGLELGQNLWTLNLPQIAGDLEKLPYVSSARIERHFPDTITILITERVPVVKVYGLGDDLATREMYYLDRDRVVLKPREDEAALALPEVLGLTNVELVPGAPLDQPILKNALELLDAIDHTSLHTMIDIRTIDLSKPLSITMVTTQDLKITFRLNNIEEQLARLQRIVEYPGFQQRAFRTIDLTPNRNVPVTFNE